MMFFRGFHCCFFNFCGVEGLNGVVIEAGATMLDVVVVVDEEGVQNRRWVLFTGWPGERCSRYGGGPPHFISPTSGKS